MTRNYTINTNSVTFNYMDNTSKNNSFITQDHDCQTREDIRTSLIVWKVKTSEIAQRIIFLVDPIDSRELVQTHEL